MTEEMKRVADAVGLTESDYVTYEGKEVLTFEGVAKLVGFFLEFPAFPEEVAEMPDWTCRICGCSQTNACMVADESGRFGPCEWVAPNLCSNRDCVAKGAL